MIYITVFNTSSVIQLRGADFVLGDKDPTKRVTLVWENCMLALFYGENQESKDLMRIFGSAAVQSPSVKFGACNILYEKEVASAFTQVGTTRGPLDWVAMRGYPFILAYQGGYPVGFYNGPREVQALLDFALTTACRSTYSERVQLAAGVQAEANYQIPPYDPYGVDPKGKANPELTRSSQFKAGDAIRGYDPNLGVAYSGSPQAVEAARLLTEAEEERAKRGGVLFPPPELEPARSSGAGIGVGGVASSPPPTPRTSPTPRVVPPR